MRRALLLILDGAGVGEAPDAHLYGDEGAATIPNVLAAHPDTRLPTLLSLGLAKVLGDAAAPPARASWGRMRERSAGKDSTTGHWELAGMVLDRPFATFDAFPARLVHAIERDAGVQFIGNRAASGTAILDLLGPEHLRTGRPILYTSADSVLQIAAHEDVIPLGRLYDICLAARRHADDERIGRVIARPFRGDPGAFVRTSGRRDFSIPPPPTVLDALRTSGVQTHTIGKVGELFAGRGLDTSTPTENNAHGMRTTAELWSTAEPPFLLVTNLVDFDTLYGHRRDSAGFAAALAAFDRWLGGFLPHVSEGDLVVIAADHGNDPTFKGTDHTREEAPLLVIHADAAEPLGVRETFADVAATLAEFFGAPPGPAGTSFLPAAAPSSPVRRTLRTAP